MSAKISKKSAQQTAAGFSTPQDASASHHRSRSPLSPTRVSRMAEKAELQSLNERLAVYMDTVRSLEKENSRLVKEVEITRESIHKEKRTYTAMYEKELSDARRMLDDVSGQKARLEIENKRLREENEDLKSGLDKTTKELRGLEAKLNVQEHRFADLQTKYNKAAADLKSKEDDARELEKVKKALEQQKKCAEHETLARVELENKLQTLKEDANFKAQLYEEEVTQLQTKRQKEISEIDGRLTVQYEDKLQSALMELRDQYEAQLQTNRDEIINLYENKLRRLEEYNNKHQNDSQSTVAELRSYQSRYNTVVSQLTSLENANTNLLARIKDLETELELERTRSIERTSALEQELAASREETNQQLREYQDLMEIKVVLDSELNAYRKLLEFEENRLNIVPSGRTRRGTPQRRGTPVLPGKASKRRRINLEESDEFKISMIAPTDLTISDVDPEGKFVQLHNKGDKELAIGGWTIKHIVGEEGSGRETTFKLHRSVKIEPNGHVTVHSADAGQSHEPPHNIVMKQKWFSGDPSTTTLTNSDGEVVVTRQRTKENSSTYLEEYEDETDQSAPQKQECLIM